MENGEAFCRGKKLIFDISTEFLRKNRRKAY